MFLRISHLAIALERFSIWKMYCGGMRGPGAVARIRGGFAAFVDEYLSSRLEDRTVRKADSRSLGRPRGPSGPGRAGEPGSRQGVDDPSSQVAVARLLGQEVNMALLAIAQWGFGGTGSSSTTNRRRRPDRPETRRPRENEGWGRPSSSGSIASSKTPDKMAHRWMHRHGSPRPERGPSSLQDSGRFANRDEGDRPAEDSRSRGDFGWLSQTIEILPGVITRVDLGFSLRRSTSNYPTPKRPAMDDLAGKIISFSR